MASDFAASAERADGDRMSVRTAMVDESLARDRTLVLVGAGAAGVAVASQAFQEVYQQVTGTAVETGLPVLGNVAYAGQIAMMPFFVVALYLVQRTAFGRLGVVATVVALLGTVLWSAASMHQLLDVVAARDPVPDAPVQVIIVVISFFALYAVGLILLGIATWRAGVLPKPPAIMLTVGVPIALTIGGAIPVFFLVYGAGAAWLGIAAARVPALRR